MVSLFTPIPNDENRNKFNFYKKEVKEIQFNVLVRTTCRVSVLQYGPGNGQYIKNFSINSTIVNNLKGIKTFQMSEGTFGPSVILIVVNLLIFLPLVFLHNSFLKDDFLIFSQICHKISIPISTNPSEEYFLFTRPLVYFSFWLDYNMWHTWAAGMKLTSLAFHLINANILFYLLLLFKKYLKKQIPNYFILLIAIAFSFYPDNLVSIIWISNRTELLSTLFYSAAILAVFKYLISAKNNNWILSLYFLFFLFSLLSKQQGIHLPILIFVMLYIFRDKIPVERFYKVRNLSITGIFLSIFFSFLNLVLYTSYLPNFPEFFQKKPFSLIGIILYVINPFLGEYIYSYFIFHKSLALILFLTIIIISLILYMYKRPPIKNLVLICLLTGIIFYPRIFAVGGDRLNSIMVFWFYTAIGLYVIIKSHKRSNLVLLLLLILINLTSSRFSILS